MRFLALAMFAPLFGCATSHVIAEDVPHDSGTSQPDGNSFPPMDAPNDGPMNGCSNDLRDVLDPQGNFLQTCGPDKGCSNGVCVPACDAAAASHNSIGCDYVVATPRFMFGTQQPCYVALVTNNWVAPMPVHVSRAGVTYDATKFGRIAETGKPDTQWQPLPASGVPVGKVAVLFLSDDPTPTLDYGGPFLCPVTPAIHQANGSEIAVQPVNGTSGRGQAWHITTELPATMYDLLSYDSYPLRENLSSASLLYPTSSWGTNYFAYVPGPQLIHYNSFHPNNAQYGQLVAMKDGTTVDVLPNVDLPGAQGLISASANVKTSYTLNAGEYLQWQRDESADGLQTEWDMSGTVIQASAPVSFVGGASYFTPDSDTYPISVGKSADHKQLPAISNYGFEYAVAPYATRLADLSDESIVYRILATSDGTALTYDPPIQNAPTSLDKGQVAAFEAKGGFVVRSQDANHPFLVAQVMATTSHYNSDFPPSRPGCNQAWLAFFGAGECALGAPESVIVLPPSQFLQKYVFFTDPRFATSNLVFVRTKTNAGFQDVTLDCAGTLSGWKPLGTSGQYEMLDIDLVRAEQQNGNCGNGPHSASSKAPFGLVVWGLDGLNSYAYPAGGNAYVVNPVVVLPNPN